MRYKLSKQENHYFCVPACLQAILRRRNVELTQVHIAEEIGLDGTIGAELDNVKRFLASLSFDFNYLNYNETPFNEPDFFLHTNLREGKDILLARPNSAGKHVLLVEEFQDPKIFVADPEDAERYTTNIYDVMGIMFSKKSGGFGLVKRL